MKRRKKRRPNGYSEGDIVKISDKHTVEISVRKNEVVIKIEQRTA